MNIVQNMDGVVYANLERPANRQAPAVDQQQQPETVYAPIVSA